MDLTTLEVGIASGIGLGSVYALIAVSFTLIVAATGYFNFALETVISVGGMLAYVLSRNAHFGVVATILLVVVVGALLGGLLELVAHRVFEGRATDVAMAVLLTTLGLSIAGDSVGGIVFGTDPRSVPSYVATQPVTIAGVTIARPYIVMVAVIIALTVVLELVFRKTRVGRNLRATQSDSEGAALFGQDIARTSLAVFMISGALAALAGFLITPVTSASSATGSALVVPAFAAIGIGGFGSFRGAIGGGLAVGIVSSLIPLYASSYWVNPVLFGLIVAVLLLWPRGLFASRSAREL